MSTLQRCDVYADDETGGNGKVSNRDDKNVGVNDGDDAEDDDDSNGFANDGIYAKDDDNFDDYKFIIRRP